MTPRHHAGVGDDLGKEGFQMAKGDYRQGQNETGIATHQPLTADGWTIVDGAPEQAIRIDSGTFKMGPLVGRSEEHTSELQSLMRISYAVFCLKTKNIQIYTQ